MKATALEFTSATELVKAINWVSEPDTQLAEGCALRHIFLEQITGSTALLIGYGKNDIWLHKLINSNGIIGTTYLLDGADILERIGTQEAWLNNILRITKTKSNSANLECISQTGTVLGNALISTYNGSVDEFVVTNKDIEWKPVATITSNAREYTKAVGAINNFGGLPTDTTAKGVWFSVADRNLYLMSTEKGGDRGNNMCIYEMNCLVSYEIQFGIQGKYLRKTTGVWGETETIRIDIDDLDAPTRARFYGGLGFIDLPILDETDCRTLSNGAMSIFFDSSNYVKETKAVRVFDSTELANGVGLQLPRKSNTISDIVLELDESENLIVSKRSDITRKEQSLIRILDNENNNVEPWVPIVLSHTYFTEALKYATSFEDLSGSDIATDFDYDVDEDFKPSSSKALLLTQVLVPKYKRWMLFVEPTFSSSIRTVSMVSTKEATNDMNEAD